MGYILPIQFDQYTQYANRTLKEEQKAFTLAPVSRATIDTKLYYGKMEYTKYRPIPNGQGRIRSGKDGKFDKILGELTGKGQHVNEYA